MFIHQKTLLIARDFWPFSFHNTLPIVLRDFEYVADPVKDKWSDDDSFGDRAFTQLHFLDTGI